MTTFSQFRWGTVLHPVAAPAVNTPLLESCDPALAAILQFCKTVINFYVGPCLLGAAGTKTPQDQPIQKAVAQVVPIDPTRCATHTLFRFPLLAGYRLGSTYGNKTTVWLNRDTSLRVLYILPPLDAESLFMLDPILTSVETTVADRLWRACDSNYKQNQAVFTENGIAKAWLAESSRGHVVFGTDIDFPALILDIKMEEQQDTAPAGPPHLESDLDIENAADPDNPIDHMIDVKSGNTTP